MNTFDNRTNVASTVLVVDDDPGARLLVGTALEMAGFRVFAASDGASALAQFREQAADCVVLDVVMPGMNGFEVCSALRAMPECRHVPILMQTSLDDMESVNRAYNAGATDFSSKGINPMLLAQRVKFLVRAKQTQDQLRRARRGCDTSPTTILSPHCPIVSGCCRYWNSRSHGRRRGSAVSQS